MLPKNGKNISCEICGKDKYFAKWEQKPQYRKHFYCSQECNLIGKSKFYSGEDGCNWQGGKIQVECDNCHKIIHKDLNVIKNAKLHFCNTKCMGEYQSEFLIGKNHPNFGKKFPEQSKRMKKNNPMSDKVTRDKMKASSKEAHENGMPYSNFQGGWQNKYKCIDCGIQVCHGSLRCKSHANTGILSSSFGKCTNPPQWFKYNKKYFRSSWEANFAKWCDLSNVKWDYESRTFHLGDCTYTPDFYLPEFDLWIEIKGYWRKDAKEKFTKFKRLFKEINIEVFEKNKLSEIGVIK